MDTTLCYLICLSCLPQTVHTSRDCAVLNVMGQYTVDQDTTAGCCAGRMPRIADACSSCGLDTEKCGRRCSSTDAVSGQDGLAAILPSAGVGASAPTSTLVSMPATTAAGIYKALQATSTTTSGGVLINRVLAHHIQHSTFATCVHYLRQAAEADQVGQGRVHCICCRKTNSCRFGHGCRFDG